jgi:hypothetical protein
MTAKSVHRDLWVFVVLLLSVPSISWFSCGGGGGGGISAGPANPSKLLSWDAPTQFADGGALDPATDLSSYEIYINETGNFLLSDTPKAISPAVDPSSGRAVTTYDLGQVFPRLQVGKTYFLAIRTVEKNGGKSGFSDPSIWFIY